MGTNDIIKKVLETLESGEIDEGKRILKDFLKMMPNGTSYRIKFGMNTYTGNEWTCCYKGCGRKFTPSQKGCGIIIRIERYSDNKYVDVALCNKCLDAGHLYETIFTFETENPIDKGKDLLKVGLA